MSDRPLPVDPGLLDRFRSAGAQIAWRPAPPAGGPPRRRPAPTPVVRIAHLHDEEARIEERAARGRRTVVVESGPVGALVVLLEADRRGVPSRLVAREADEVPGFHQGAIEAEWSRAKAPDHRLPFRDLVELARYALA